MGRSHRARAGLAVVGLVALVSPACSHNKRAAADNDALFARARDQIARRHFFEARQTLGDMGLFSPIPEPLEAEKSLALADAYFFDGGSINAIEAQSRYQQFLDFHPLHPKSSYARYMVGLCLMAQAEAPEKDQDLAHKAAAHFQSMVAELPASSTWGRAARVMLLKAQDRLAEHQWTVAQFYLGRKKWPGAIGRLKGLVDEYPGARRRGEALYELARAHLAAGQAEAAAQRLEQLLAEYPHGPFAEQARGLQKGLPAAPDQPPKTAGAGPGRGETGPH